MILPYRFYWKYVNEIFEEDHIDMGIITSHDIGHRYNVRIENRIGKPAVITRVEIETKCFGMKLKVATIFGYRVVLHPGMPSFDLLSLIIVSDGKAKQGFVTGYVHIYMDVGGSERYYSISFEGAFFLDMFANEEQMSF